MSRGPVTAICCGCGDVRTFPTWHGKRGEHFEQPERGRFVMSRKCRATCGSVQTFAILRDVNDPDRDIAETHVDDEQPRQKPWKASTLAELIMTYGVVIEGPEVDDDDDEPDDERRIGDVRFDAQRIIVVPAQSISGPCFEALVRFAVQEFLTNPNLDHDDAEFGAGLKNCKVPE